MKRNAKTSLLVGLTFIITFIVWTILIKTVDVKPLGVNESLIGFSALNVSFHKLTGVHMNIYTITDWLGIVPIAICFSFGVMGLVQWIKRKDIWKVDGDILILGVYYLLVILAYIIFEMIPINYRPVLIDGRMEASYPSSTSLLVLCVMSSLVFEIKRRANNKKIRTMVMVVSILFSIYMVIGRLVSGVHWLTDIIAAVILSMGLYCIFLGCVLYADRRKKN